MKDQLEIVNASFEKIIPKNDVTGFWGGLWQFLTTVAVLIFCGFYLVFLNPLGWISLVILTCLYKFIIGG